MERDRAATQWAAMMDAASGAHERAARAWACVERERRNHQVFRVINLFIAAPQSGRVLARRECIQKALLLVENGRGIPLGLLKRDIVSCLLRQPVKTEQQPEHENVSKRSGFGQFNFGRTIAAFTALSAGETLYGRFHFRLLRKRGSHGKGRSAMGGKR